MILSGVENAEYDDAVSHDAVENLVRKTSGEQATEAAVVVRGAFGMAFEALNEWTQFAQELVA